MPKPKYKASSSAESQFYRALKKVAQYSGHIVDAHTNGATITDLKKMTEALQRYAEALGPWATKQASKMLVQVQKSNARAYQNQSKEMGRLLKTNVAERDTGRVAAALLNEQVALIKSIPVEAGLRAQKIAAENYLQGLRALPDQETITRLKDEMGMSTEVAVNRAKLIARTETARANSSFVQARAQAVGVTHYRWIASMDGATRPSHAKMHNKIVAYADPPLLIDGTSGHAGTFPNCRCYQDPILPDVE